MPAAAFCWNDPDESGGDAEELGGEVGGAGSPRRRDTTGAVAADNILKEQERDDALRSARAEALQRSVEALKAGRRWRCATGELAAEKDASAELRRELQRFQRQAEEQSAHAKASREELSCFGQELRDVCGRGARGLRAAAAALGGRLPPPVPESGGPADFFRWVESALDHASTQLLASRDLSPRARSPRPLPEDSPDSASSPLDRAAAGSPAASSFPGSAFVTPQPASRSRTGRGAQSTPSKLPRPSSPLGGRAKDSPEEWKQKFQAQRELLEAQAVKLMREEELRRSSEAELRALLEEAQEARLEAASAAENLREELRSGNGSAVAIELACATAVATALTGAEEAHGRRFSALETSCAEALRTAHHRCEEQQWRQQAIADQARQHAARSEQEVAHLRASLREAAGEQAAAEDRIRAELDAERTMVYGRLREQMAALTARPPLPSARLAGGLARPPDVADQQIV